jgi:hypothetical protein
MPSAKAVPRMLVASLLVLVTTAGCGDLEQAAAAGGAHDDLAGDLATQLGGSASLTYAATYQLAGGETATITQAQKPTRSAYAYPGGKVTLTPDATTVCAQAGKKMTCTATAPATTSSPTPPTVFAGAGKSGMALPDVVLGLLNATTLDAAKTVTQHDTTVAGRHATCLTISSTASAEFTACVTSEGALGSFTGALNGVAVDEAMTHYTDKIDDSDFLSPAGATIVDHR